MRPIFICLCYALIGSVFFSCQKNNTSVLVTAINKLEIARSDETILLKRNELKKYLSSILPEFIQIVEQNSGKILVSQTVDSDNDGSFDELIFQSDFAPGETKNFVIKEVVTPLTKKPKSKVFARFVPERKDDFAWENDRIAFRMYGPALQATGEISSGVDVWVKSTRDLIIDKWYVPGYNYHTDFGEGLDYYKVGASTGCGGIAIRDGKKMFYSDNFTKWIVIANGPIRTVFELTYNPWNVNGKKISEVKRITLDAGHNLNRFESIFSSQDFQSDFSCAIGIVKRENKGFSLSNQSQGWLRYWEPKHPKNGTIGCAIVVDPLNSGQMTETADHNLVIINSKLDEPVVYYAGAAWSKSQDFKDVEDWDEYISCYSQKLSSPIQVTISKL